MESEDRIDIDSLVNKTKKIFTKEDHGLKKEQVNSRRELVELDGQERFFKLRTQWSWFIFFWITVIIVFHMIFVFSIGCGYLKFESKGWIVVITIVEGFLEIIGMGWIVVKFLYHKNDKKSNNLK